MCCFSPFLLIYKESQDLDCSSRAPPPRCPMTPRRGRGGVCSVGSRGRIKSPRQAERARGERDAGGTRQPARFLVVGTLSFITVPQTVAVIMDLLRPRSLAMWSDFGAYLIGILAFHVLVQNMDSPGQSKRRLVWYDIIASSAGLLLLLASCTRTR